MLVGVLLRFGERKHRSTGQIRAVKKVLKLINEFSIGGELGVSSNQTTFELGPNVRGYVGK